MNRRKFLGLTIKTAAGIATGGGIASLAAAGSCVVTRRTVSLPGMPAVFEGFRIALLSDFHHSPWISQEQIAAAVQLANREAPDLVALAGDYVNHHGRRWAPGCMAELSKLRARHGAVSVLGNHDHYENAEAHVRRAIAAAGIEDLTNCGIPVMRDGQSLWIRGVGDLWHERQKPRRALAGANRPGSAVMLSHNPDYAEELNDDRVGLMLSGHTHGGQIVLPFLGAPILPSRFGQKYASGLCQGPTTPVYVTRGIGSAFPPLRFCCPPEVTVLTLTKTVQPA